MKLLKVIFHTEGLVEELADESATLEDFETWKKVYAILDGKSGLVIPAYDGNGYIFLGADDGNKAKEFFWNIEQDSFIGRYINDRDGFDEIWDSGEYSLDGSINFPEKYVEIIGEIE